MAVGYLDALWWLEVPEEERGCPQRGRAACAKPGLPGDMRSLERLEMWDPTMWDTTGLCLEYTDGFELCKGRGGQSDDSGGHL